MTRMVRPAVLFLFVTSGCVQEEIKVIDRSDHPKYEARKGEAIKLQVIAENNQFFVCDLERDPFTRDGEDRKKGQWLKNANSVTYFTKGQLNLHRVDVVFDSKFDPDEEAERTYEHRIALPSGVFTVNDYFQIKIPAGDYMLHAEAFNLGVEDDDMAFLENDEFLRVDSWERYKLTLIPIGE